MPPKLNFAQQLFDKGNINPETFGKTVHTHIGEAHSMFHYPNQELETSVFAPEMRPPLGGTLAPYTGAWTVREAAHLLRRTCFGAKQSEIDLFLSTGAMQSVDHVLRDLPAPTSLPINNYNNPDFTDPVVPLGETWLHAAFNLDAEGLRLESWRGWWYQRMLDQEASILERLTLFWHNHFATQTQSVFFGRMAYDYNQLLRAQALTNFKQMVKAVTLNPMMLVYLNGHLNSKDDPDENYARELQELFTIGKDNSDHYTEDDVIAAAKVLTGWKIDWSNATSFPEPSEHDTSNKQFSAFYGSRIIQGGTDMEAELDALLDMLFQKNETAEYLCRKLYRWFVYYQIDAQTEAQIIKPLAALFRLSNYNIKPVLEALLKSTHFYEAAQHGAYLKTPLDITIGLYRTLEVEIPGTTLYDNFLFKYYLTYFHAEMKMIPGDPPGVAGWQAYRQAPHYHRIWINSDTIRVRNVFTDIMAGYYLETDNDRLQINLPAYAEQFADTSDPNAFIQRMSVLFFARALTPAKQFVLKSILLSGLPSDSYWTTAWQTYLDNPNDPMLFEVVNTRLVALFAYMMRLPEYQLS